MCPPRHASHSRADCSPRRVGGPATRMDQHSRESARPPHATVQASRLPSARDDYRESTSDARVTHADRATRRPSDGRRVSARRRICLDLNLRPSETTRDVDERHVRGGGPVKDGLADPRLEPDARRGRVGAVGGGTEGERAGGEGRRRAARQRDERSARGRTSRGR